jgi:hypothetical protein
MSIARGVLLGQSGRYILYNDQSPWQAATATPHYSPLSMHAAEVQHYCSIQLCQHNNSLLRQQTAAVYKCRRTPIGLLKLISSICIKYPVLNAALGDEGAWRSGLRTSQILKVDVKGR